MKILIRALLITMFSCSFSLGEGGRVELEAHKDMFARSNHRNKNSGGSEFMLLVPAPGVRAIIGFDLSSVTNEILSAELSFRVFDSSSSPLSLTVAPMVYHASNTLWKEGAGKLGLVGRNAVGGEATYQWKAFRDKAWKDEEGKAVVNMADSKLWKDPIASLRSQAWREGEWITLKITDVSMLEELRKTEEKSITYGLWGSSGSGVYRINARESGKPAKLILTVKEESTQVAGE